MSNENLSSLAPFSDESELVREGGDPILNLGQWVLVTRMVSQWDAEAKRHGDVEVTSLGCISNFGSNYVEVSFPCASRERRSSLRIHQDLLWESLQVLSDQEAEIYINDQVSIWRGRSSALLSEVKELTSRLGLNAAAGAVSSGTALATLSSKNSISDYKNALIEAKEKQLPALFEEMKGANSELARWMSAHMLPIQVVAGDMKSYVSEIQDRIFNIGLYAGLSESAVQCCDGSPASIDEPLHVMQRRCYMDEECLANYKAGGMTFEHIEEFDEWISAPENRDRILPFPRTIVAMRVRRKVAERDWDGSLLGAFVMIRGEITDKYTFLYVRNGDQVWRISTEIEFDQMIFPDRSIYDPSEPMMVKMFGGRVDKIITRNEYESMRAEQEDYNQKSREWKEANPFEEWVKQNPGQDRHHWQFKDPFWSRVGSHSRFRDSDWAPMDSSNLFFDDAMQVVSDEIKKYNRIATIIQGIFDRSLVLHPHNPVKTWTGDGFAKAVKLVYDANMVIPDGEKPDFEAYRASCNASMGKGSIVTGQREYWLHDEAKKEMARRSGDYHLSESERYRIIRSYAPMGNQGPEDAAPIMEWKPRSKVAVFRWSREPRSWRNNDPIPCSLSVPVAELFNISAYRPGDFKRFFKDSRTRAEYLKWAPLLLTAEDWWVKRGS